MVGIRRFAFIAAACLALSLPAVAEDQKPGAEQPVYAPGLNDMMVATQLRHFKLWYAGVAQNWPLANYELAQIRDTIVEVKRIDGHESNMSMMTPAADDLDQAIKARDSVKFAKAFSRLTASCNACHEQTGFGFIKIQDPRLSPIETSPFSDESFSGR
jgi:hypothetical protein